MKLIVENKEALPSLDILDGNWEHWISLHCVVGRGAIKDMYKYNYSTITKEGSWRWMCHVSGNNS